MRSALLLLWLAVVCQAGHGSTVRIRLFSAMKPETVVFSARSGAFLLEIPGRESERIEINSPVIVWSSDGRVGVKWGEERGVVADSVRIYQAGNSESEGLFAVSVPGTAGERRYSGSIVCRNNNGIFLVINETDIEDYLPGVILAEGGPGRHPEFYKAQAVLARTFAWLNIGKHATDGYHLCDDVHCQAYHGITADSSIVGSVEKTSGLVMVSRDSILVLPAFHSNCGGQTATAGDAWVTDMKHLQSVTDPFCLSSRNAVWRASFAVEQWTEFLERHGHSGGLTSGASHFEQDTRKQFYEPAPGIKIPVRTIRAGLGLRSALFSLRVEGDSVLFGGRGYGHGVGMCQEGAMEMARQGYTFSRILAFYFNEVALVEVSHARYPHVPD